MGKLKNAVVGVSASAIVAIGAYGVEVLTDDAKQDAVSQCADDFDSSEERRLCIVGVNDTYDDNEGLKYLEFAGVVGVIGCGYLGYKAVKEANDTTGIIDDWL